MIVSGGRRVREIEKEREGERLCVKECMRERVREGRRDTKKECYIVLVEAEAYVHCIVLISS